MKSPHLRRYGSLLLLLALALMVALVPQFSRLHPAAAQVGASASCLATETPVGTSAPTGSLTTVPCPPGVISGSTGLSTFTVCGTVSAYSAPSASSNGSITINGTTYLIPAGVAFNLSSITVGQPAGIQFTVSSSGAIVFVTSVPGCTATPVPLAGNIVTGGTYRTGRSQDAN